MNIYTSRPKSRTGDFSNIVIIAVVLYVMYSVLQICLYLHVIATSYFYFILFYYFFLYSFT